MIHIPTMVKEWEVSNYCDAMEGYHKMLATCNFDLEFIIELMDVQYVHPRL